MVDLTTFEISGEDDSHDTVTIPSGLLDLLAEEGDDAATVIGDLALLGCAQRIHAAVHHAHGEPDAELEALEESTMELFEERFGATYAELTGHAH